MQQFLNVTIQGLTSGMIYAAFALALVLIWRSTRIVNFAQGSMAAATAFIALALIQAGYSYWLAFVVALASGFVLGAIVERVIIRPVEGGPELNAVIVTLGLFVALQALIAIIFGSSFQSFPTPFGVAGFEVGDTTIPLTPTSLYVLGSVVVTMLLLVALFRFTRLGLAMRASAFGQEVARLLGNGEACLLLGHGAVTASSAGVEGAVLAMVHLEHQARLNYMAMCAAGPNHPSIPLPLAEEIALARPEAEPHIKARLAHVPGGRPHGGIWAYFREVVTADM